MEEGMAKVKVHQEVHVWPDPTVSICYPAGFEGTAPHAHIDQIVASGRGERVGGEQHSPAPQQSSGVTGAAVTKR